MAATIKYFDTYKEPFVKRKQVIAKRVVQYCSDH